MDNKTDNKTDNKPDITKVTDFDYTIVLDGHYLAPEIKKEEEKSFKEIMDRLYYQYEIMCLNEPTVLDKDDAYPHSYQWRMGDKYDPGKEAVLREALKLGEKIENTESYQKYVEEVGKRKFKPDSWD